MNGKPETARERIKLTLPTHINCWMTRSVNKFHTFQALIAKQVKYDVKFLLLQRFYRDLDKRAFMWFVEASSGRRRRFCNGDCLSVLRCPSARSWTSWLAISTIPVRQIDRMALFILSHILLFVREETAKIMPYTMQKQFWLWEWQRVFLLWTVMRGNGHSRA